MCAMSSVHIINYLPLVISGPLMCLIWETTTIEIFYITLATTLTSNSTISSEYKLSEGI